MGESVTATGATATNANATNAETTAVATTQETTQVTPEANAEEAKAESVTETNETKTEVAKEPEPKTEETIDVEAIKAEAFLSGQKLEMERLKALIQLAPDKPKFVLEQFEAGNDIAKAKEALATVVAAESQMQKVHNAAKLKVEAMNAATATTKTNQPAKSYFDKWAHLKK